MHPRLRPQPAVRRLPLDENHHATQAGLVSCARVQRSHWVSATTDGAKKERRENKDNGAESARHEGGEGMGDDT